MAAIDLSGKTFTRLTVIERTPGHTDKRVSWLCRCECGTETIVTTHDLRRGNTKSCGCLRRDNATIHGLSHVHDAEHHCWRNIFGRCLNPENKMFRYYGGRGITICDRWRDFVNFLADMGPRPSPGHSLDRINNDGNYEPGNCRWATLRKQMNNRRNNRIVNYRGNRMTLAEAIREAGANKATVINRLHLGWTLDQALTTPIRRYGPHSVVRFIG